jgi:TonB family protein
MKTSTIIALLLFAISFVQQDSPELKEADDLSASVVKLFNEKDFDKALPLAKRALEIRQRLLPRTDQRIAASLSNLASLYSAKGNYDAARETVQQLIQVQEERSGPDDVSLSRTLDRLALLYLRDGDNGKAEETYKRAIALKEKGLKPEDPQLGQSLEGLATVYRARKDFDRGAPLYKRALTIYGQASGVKSPAFQEASLGFACLAYESGKYDEVKDLNEIWKRFSPADALIEVPEANFLNKKAVKLPAPSYPANARAQRISGTVVMKISIDEKGDVIDIRDMCQGPPFITSAAISAARGARFEPAMVNGRAVKAEGVLVYRFVAQ